ncbi:MAG: hypothetical protein GY716_15725 [bacterium]|nr:hypothetical protein [bacterium]
MTTETERSAESTPDAQDVDISRVDLAVAGTIASELSYGTHDARIEASLRGVFTPKGGTVTFTGDGAADIVFTAADSSLNNTGDDFLALGFKKGQRVTVSDSVVSAGANNGGYILGTVTALKMLLTTDGRTAATIVDEAAVAATVHTGSLVTDRTTLSFDGPSNEIRDSGNGFVDDGFVAGQWITITDASNGGNNGLFRIDSVLAGAMPLTHGSTIVTEAAAASIDLVTERYVENGTTDRSFSVEKRFNDRDDADKFVQETGIVYGGFTVNVSIKQIITIEFPVIGKLEVDGGGATYGTADSAATTTRPYTAVASSSALFEDGSTFKVTDFSIEVAQNLEALTEAFELGAACVVAGTVQVSGAFSTFYRTKATMDKYLAFDETQFVLKLVDAAGNTDLIEIPSAFLASGSRTGSGKNSRVVSPYTFDARKDPVQGKTIRWVTIPA